MTVKLTDELRQALAAEGDTPVRIVDERSNTVYVLLREDVYERVKDFLVGEELTSSEIGRLIDQTMREYDEGDPLLESYQKPRPPAGPSYRPG